MLGWGVFPGWSLFRVWELLYLTSIPVLKPFLLKLAGASACFTAPSNGRTTPTTRTLLENSGQDVQAG